MIIRRLLEGAVKWALRLFRLEDDTSVKGARGPFRFCRMCLTRIKQGAEDTLLFNALGAAEGAAARRSAQNKQPFPRGRVGSRTGASDV